MGRGGWGHPVCIVSTPRTPSRETRNTCILRGDLQASVGEGGFLKEEQREKVPNPTWD